MKKRALTDNQHLKLAALRPTGQYALVRFDKIEDTTPGGLILPNNRRRGALTSDPIKEQQAMRYENTAVVLAIGPEVVGVSVGERYLMTCPVIPVGVCDSDDDEPLGLIGAPDLLLKVEA